MIQAEFDTQSRFPLMFVGTHGAAGTREVLETDIFYILFRIKSGVKLFLASVS